MSKRTLQDAFAEGNAKENEILERLGTQKHERAIGELELKRRKLENKAMEKQHQREREREQHKIRMMQMRMMMSQNQHAASASMISQSQQAACVPMMMQGQGFGLMAELNDTTVSSESPSLSSFSM
jgi:predicted NodU family carbamoyl transferase